MIKKLALFSISLSLLCCFLLFECSTLFPECSAVIVINNELDFDIYVTIDGDRKHIPGWGNCQVQINENTYLIVPCAQSWDVKWPKPSSLSCWPAEEDEEVVEAECEPQYYSISLEGVEGLDTEIVVENYDDVTLTVYDDRWK